MRPWYTGFFSALALACTAAPSSPPATPEPVSESVPTPDPAPEAAAPPAPLVPPSPPTTPALESFTGQGTHLGSGLRCAFYPLGWSDDGLFAYAEERMVNDMDLAYGVRWAVVDAASGEERASLEWSVTEWDRPPSMAIAWAASEPVLDTIFARHAIRGTPDTTLTAPPWTVGEETVGAEWRLTPEDRRQRAMLVLHGSGAPEATLLDTWISDLAPSPAPPSLVQSPDGQHALVVAALPKGEPVEALVDIDFLLFAFPKAR